MSISERDIRWHLRNREDSSREFKQFAFNGNCPTSPNRKDLADEITALANANGGWLYCGVHDDGQIQGLTAEQMAAVDGFLVEISLDAIKPALYIDVHHHELDGKCFVIAQIPRGHAVHECAGRAFIRVGSSKRQMDSVKRLRLAQERAQFQYLGFDSQVVPSTGFNSLSERLWEQLLSLEAAADPRQGLKNIRLLASDEGGVDRATVAGVLLCCRSPQDWLPQATIVATSYRGHDQASGQLDAQEIVGPLPEQIAGAVKFVVRNMRVSARKVPERVNLPQYRETVLFEAIVNAVVHRDYSMRARQIRLSMFKGRLHIDSPGVPPNGMTIDGMRVGQATRNEVIASVFGRIPVRDIPGADHRRYLMDRRGDGVPVILRETREATGTLPRYEIVDESNLVLSIPAAKIELCPSQSTVTVHSSGEPLPGVMVLAMYPNGTWQQAISDESGEALLDLYTTNLPMTVYVAAQGYAAGLEQEWLPDRGGVLIDLARLENGGATIFTDSQGQLPGLRGRLNPKRDSSDRTYLYADNIAIDEGRRQPVPFRLGKPMRITDSFGVEMSVTFMDFTGRCALVEYRVFDR